ncbi:hypothetical protein BGW38_000663 [Lunasporangiospora selenospora]|uniref:C2 domain-containing protein n=1 Tax=Lunasporangiospora selenospora TaxID=979761 RepID=A0A9P6FVS4_9FUNG|nr:hypothetical protein BGW38_000663 [Lunasporangiospora selenospora]
MYGEQHIDIDVFRAAKLEDVDKFGDNDPYVFAFTNSLEKDDVKKGARTEVAKKGRNPNWNQQLHLKGVRADALYLYIEVMDDETGIDEPIAFATIPLQQVRNANGQRLQGSFDLYNKDGREHGALILGIRIRQPSEDPDDDEEGPHSEERRVSMVDEDHKARFKKLVNKEHLGDAAQVVAAGAAAAAIFGAVFGGSKQKKAAPREQ